MDWKKHIKNKLEMVEKIEGTGYKVVELYRDRGLLIKKSPVLYSYKAVKGDITLKSRTLK